MFNSSRLFALSEQLRPLIQLNDRILLGNHKSFLKTTRPAGQNQVFDSRFTTLKLFHSDSVKKAVKHDEDEEAVKAVLLHSDFENAKTKDKKTFLQLVKIYEKNFGNRAGHVDFIRAALRQMEAFGVHRDLEAYKKILDVLPKGVYVAKNFMLVEGMFYPRQQFVAAELLMQMEDYRVGPDKELGEILIKIFGPKAHPTTKYKKMMYWNVKLKNLSPWLLPESLPSNPFLLAKLAIERITSVDVQTKVSVFKSEEIPESIDKTWIVSGQSQTQRELLEKHSPEVPVIVEGGDVVWLRDECVSYFVLKADVDEPRPYVPPGDGIDISKFESISYSLNELAVKQEDPSVHEQDDGIIYAVCATGTSTKDSLLSWVRLLQKNGNPTLGKLPVLFRFKNEEKAPAPFSQELVNQEENKQPS